MKFHERLRELRKQSTYTQKELAEKLGISTITIRQYEQGTREPNIERILRLALIFNVSTDELLCISDFKTFLEESSDES